MNDDAQKLSRLRHLLGFSMRQMAALFKITSPNGADTIRKIIDGKSRLSGPMSILVEQMLPIAEAIDAARKTQDKEQKNG